MAQGEFGKWNIATLAAVVSTVLALLAWQYPREPRPEDPEASSTTYGDQADASSSSGDSPSIPTTGSPAEPPAEPPAETSEELSEDSPEEQPTVPDFDTEAERELYDRLGPGWTGCLPVTADVEYPVDAAIQCDVRAGRIQQSVVAYSFPDPAARDAMFDHYVSAPPDNQGDCAQGDWYVFHHNFGRGACYPTTGNEGSQWVLMWTSGDRLMFYAAGTDPHDMWVWWQAIPFPR